MGGGDTWVIHKNDHLPDQRNWNADRDAYVINVFARTPRAPYEHVATLVGERRRIAGQFRHQRPARDRELRRRSVLLRTSGEPRATGPDPAHVRGSDAHRVVDERGQRVLDRAERHRRVLRQSDTARSATHTAVLDASNWTNQSIQADVRATAFDGSDSWLGLATRYRDAGNHYYVTMQRLGLVSLKRARAACFRRSRPPRSPSR